MRKPVRWWQLVLGGTVLIVVLVLYAKHALAPTPIRAQARPGSHPLYYEPELGAAPGLLDSLKRAGKVAPDAVDDGQGHFVSPGRDVARGPQ